MDTYVGEIKTFAFDKIPLNWLACNGQVLAVSDYPDLYSLIGAAYGGNGKTTFALPNLNGRVAVGFGTSNDNNLGAQGGTETVTLTTKEMAAHTHIMNAYKGLGTDVLNQNNDYLAGFRVVGNFIEAYLLDANTGNVPLNPKTVSFTGGGQAHENRMPFITVSYCIAVKGLYPDREL